MNKFWELLKENIIQAIVTISLTGTVIYLEIAGREISDTLNNAFLLALGFYFGSKVTLAGVKLIEKYSGGKGK